MPEEIVKFGNETMNLVTWTQRRQYAAFKDLLGPGINLHLKVAIAKLQILETYVSCVQ